MGDGSVWELMLSVGSGFLAAMISYEFIDKRSRRLIETYWHLEEEYRSDIQIEARKCLEKIDSEYKNNISTKEDSSFIKYYNKNYQQSKEENQKDIAFAIRARLRLLNKVGLLIKKRMVDRDLIFSLVGPGLEVDKNMLKSIQRIHKEEAKRQEEYLYFELLLGYYSRWKRQNAQKERRNKSRNGQLDKGKTKSPTASSAQDEVNGQLLK